MKRFCLFLILSSALAFSQGMGGSAGAGGKAGFGGGATVGAAPAYVNSTICTTGAAACTTSFSPTNGNRLYVFAANDSQTSAVACSDGEGTGNTYTRDSDTLGNGGATIRGGWFHSSSLSGSGTYVITCTGTGVNFMIGVIEASGTTGTLASVSAGTNPSTANPNTGTTNSPASFTTTDANVILVDGLADTGGATIVITQTDTSFTTRGNCSTGASCFVGAIGTRIVSATGTYSDGWTLTTGVFAGSVGAHAAYK